MFEAIVLGIVQGIAEWLPVSSEGIILIIKKSIFQTQQSTEIIIKEALFLHLGTFFAALIYFRKYILELFKDVFNFKKASPVNKKVIIFLTISTLISGILGYGLMKLLSSLESEYTWVGNNITLIIGILLLITACLQQRAKNSGYKSFKDLGGGDSVLLGIVQACAVLPGLSRSGLTVSALLFRKYDRKPALKLSFLMSLPIVLAGNIILNYDQISVNINSLLGMLFAFIFGLMTIALLMKIAEKINFAFFVFIFGILTIISAFM